MECPLEGPERIGSMLSLVASIEQNTEKAAYMEKKLSIQAGSGVTEFMSCNIYSSLPKM